MIYKSKNSGVMTRQMLETLMEVHEREMMKIDPLDATRCLSTAPLMRRGFLGTRTHFDSTGKKYIAVYVTRKGKEALSKV